MRNFVIQTQGNYSLLARIKDNGELHEFCVAYGYDKETDSWGYGSYFTKLENAMAFLKEKDNPNFSETNVIVLNKDGEEIYSSMATIGFSKAYVVGYNTTIYVDQADPKLARECIMKYAQRYDMKIGKLEFSIL